MKLIRFFLLFALLGTGFARAQSITATIQTRIDSKIAEIIGWAANPVIVEAVRTQNERGLSPELAGMDQEKWKGLPITDSAVRSLTKTQAAAWLKEKKNESVTLSFLSDAKGCKVAFTAKTSNWSHAGNPKHDVAMTGKTWQGPIEINQATGLQQIQVAVPVLDQGKPIGSLVVGLSYRKLSE